MWEFEGRVSCLRKPSLWCAPGEQNVSFCRKDIMSHIDYILQCCLWKKSLSLWKKGSEEYCPRTVTLRNDRPRKHNNAKCPCILEKSLKIFETALIEVKGEIDKSTNIVGDFKADFSFVQNQQTKYWGYHEDRKEVISTTMTWSLRYLCDAI